MAVREKKSSRSDAINCLCLWRRLNRSTCICVCAYVCVSSRRATRQLLGHGQDTEERPTEWFAIVPPPSSGHPYTPLPSSPHHLTSPHQQQEQRRRRRRQRRQRQQQDHQQRQQRQQQRLNHCCQFYSSNSNVEARPDFFFILFYFAMFVYFVTTCVVFIIVDYNVREISRRFSPYTAWKYIDLPR